jgi:hypothetical protein
MRRSGLQKNSGTTSRINARWETPDGITPSPRTSRQCAPGRETLAPIGGSELNDPKGQSDVIKGVTTIDRGENERYDQYH